MNRLIGINRAFENTIEFFIFASRWMQVPVYLGLMVGSGLYVYKFMEELSNLGLQIATLTEVQVMLSILGLIDISMVMNLLIIVIIGGYSIFTSRLNLETHEDKPAWLDHLDADRLKVKLSTSLASISGVHLLKTFIDIHSGTKEKFLELYYEIGIHMVFIISALVLAWIAKILDTSNSEAS
jgi:uncharacterized protein (TIGR00645 family)